MIVIKLILLSTTVLTLTSGFKSKGNILPDRDVCGKQEKEIIYGGVEAAIGDFPWVALLESKEHGFICGGSLINNRYVLTAAHCVLNDVYNVRLGEHNLQKDEDCDMPKSGPRYCSDKPLNVEIETTVIHDHYNPISGIPDIALIRLKQEVDYTDFIKPICLPVYSELRSKNYSDTVGIISGWGQDATGRDSDAKLVVAVPVVSNGYCVKTYAKYNIPIENSQMCAGGVKGRSACFGDGGGPLMYSYRVDDKENYVCIGLSSFALRTCALEGVPAVYTRVSEYIPWIVDNMKP